VDTNRVLNIGLAGLGRFGKLHASVLGRLPGVRIAAVCDPLPAEVAAVADRYEVAGRYTDFDQMVSDPNLDALFIVTPEQYHADHATKAIARGLPTFLEKPLATTAADGQQIADAATRAGVSLQLGFLLRFETQHAMLKQEIAAGRFGDLVSLRVKRNASRAWFPSYGDRAHTIYETSIHDLDLLLWFTATPCTHVYAVARTYSGLRYPDAVFALLQFASGAVAQVETSWFVPAGAPANVLTPTWHGTIDAELEIVGTARTGRIRLLDSGLALWAPDLTAHPETGLWPEIGGQVAGALREEVTHFLDCVRRGVPSPIASVDDAVAGLRIAEAIVESAATGREVVLETR
jgi:predicted dehydrogenase